MRSFQSREESVRLNSKKETGKKMIENTDTPRTCVTEPDAVQRAHFEKEASGLSVEVLLVSADKKCIKSTLDFILS